MKILMLQGLYCTPQLYWQAATNLEEHELRLM